MRDCGTSVTVFWTSVAVFWTSVTGLLDQCGWYSGPVWLVFWTSVVGILDRCDWSSGPVWLVFWTSVAGILDCVVSVFCWMSERLPKTDIL